MTSPNFQILKVETLFAGDITAQQVGHMTVSSQLA